MYQIFSIHDFRKNIILNSAKLAILVFFSVMVLAHFVPFYEATPDSYVYALKSESLTQGSWTVTNDLLQNTGDWVYVPNSWKKTIHNTAIPKYPPGLPVIGSIFYFVSGPYGLFYLGPILGISLLIVSERIATRLFGRYVGLLTLMFLVTNGVIWVGAKHLLADNFFAIFSILGFFFLIKFLEEKRFSNLFISSMLLSLSGFIRLNGVIYLPIEIILIGTVLIFELFKKKGIRLGKQEQNSTVLTFTSKNFIKISFFIIGPWLIFILFFASFNNYYFGNATTTFYNIPDDPWDRPGTGSYLSIFEPKSENFELIKKYSNFVLPYPIYKIETLDFEKIQEERDDPFTSSMVILFSDLVNQNNLGLLTFIILAITILFSFYQKTKIPIILIFSLIVLSSILFWSAGHVSFGRDSVFGRYLIATFPFFSILLSFVIVNFLKINTKEFKRSSRLLTKSFKIFVSLILIFFLIIAFYNSAPAQILKDEELEFSDPIIAAKYYPLDKEGLDKNSIILGGASSWSIDYGFSTFNPTLGSPMQRTAKVYNPDLLDKDVIEKLRTLVAEDESVFIFKKLVNTHERVLREFLVEEYGFTFKEYSTTFCSVQLVNNDKHDGVLLNNEKPDQVCFGG